MRYSAKGARIRRGREGGRAEAFRKGIREDACHRSNPRPTSKKTSRRSTAHVDLIEARSTLSQSTREERFLPPRSPRRAWRRISASSPAAAHESGQAGFASSPRAWTKTRAATRVSVGHHPVDDERTTASFSGPGRSTALSVAPVPAGPRVCAVVGDHRQRRAGREDAFSCALRVFVRVA